MNEKVEQIQNELGERLETLRQRLDEVKANVEDSANETRESLHKKGQAIEARFEADQQRLKDAQALVEQWLEAKAVETGEKILDWEYQREIEKLEKHADHAEDYAASAVILAAAAIDEAELAILEAIGARILAEDAKCGDTEFVVLTGTY
ncbi:MAG: hypothetical protein QNJ00_04420 [Woeseiaceae bacterium]|nr:hypothetical protein [Woeseiaceae bacterium]